MITAPTGDGARRIVKALTPAAKEAIFSVMYHWPMYELALTSLVIYCFDMKAESAPILLGTMDARTKLDRLLAYAKTTGDEKFIHTMKETAKSHAAVSPARNTIAHCPYLGHDAEFPEILLFGTLKQKAKGRYRMVPVLISDLERCAKFAHDIGATFPSLLQDQTQKESRERKRAGRPPIRTRKDRSKRRAPPQSSGR